MAQSMGQASAHGHSHGTFGHGGHHGAHEAHHKQSKHGKDHMESNPGMRNKEQGNAGVFPQGAGM
jgi:hypothetical protein